MKNAVPIQADVDRWLRSVQQGNLPLAVAVEAISELIASADLTESSLDAALHVAVLKGELTSSLSEELIQGIQVCLAPATLRAVPLPETHVGTATGFVASPATPSPDTPTAMPLQQAKDETVFDPRPRVATTDEADAGQRTVVVVSREAAPRGATVGEYAAAPRAGDVIKSRYELRAVIGRGGMGAVFSAVDRIKATANDPDPWVAIKILNPDVRSSSKAFIALQREASKAQSLAHPNIATVYNFDCDGETAFITMELLRGRSLDLAIREVRGIGLPHAQAQAIIRGIGEGLSYAHGKGIVHSDLKPSNIFLLDDGTAKILDFGIARSIPSGATGGVTDSFDAGSLGAFTPAYATAEMMRGGDAAACDDLYAMGLIAYELLSGKHPYRKKSAVAAEQLGLVPLPLKGLKRHQWRVLAASLSFSRSERPRDASEFLRRYNASHALAKLSVASAVLVLLVAGALEYRNYSEQGPSEALEALSPEVQSKVRGLLSDGTQELGFYQKDGTEYALWSAVDDFAQADQLHRGDRPATRGLERTADLILGITRGNPDLRRQAAQALAEKSEYLAGYPPVLTALAH